MRGRLKELSAEGRRFVFWRSNALPKREGHAQRLQRLYREEKPTVRRRGGRQRARALAVLEAWRRDDNTERRHSALGS